MTRTLAIALLLLGGCGGEQQPERPGAKVVAALGDSIIEGAPYAEPPWVPAAERKLGPAYEVRACGVSGERTDEIAQRLDDCAEGADVLIVQGGINDIAQGRPVADAAQDLRAMVRRGKERGLRVVMADVLPWNDGHPQADPLIAELNGLIEAIGREEGVPVLAYHATLEDPANPGLMKPEWANEDGDHPSEAGYERLGAIIDVD